MTSADISPVAPVALAALMQRCGLTPENPEAWCDLARGLLASGQPLRALSALGRAHRLAPANLDYALSRVQIAQQADMAQAELVRLTEEADADPLNTAPLAARAMLLHFLGRNVEAIDALDAACALAPDNGRIWALLGGVLARSFHLKRAEAVLKHALQLDPGNRAIRQDRAAVLLRMYRSSEAQQELQAVLEDSPDNVPLLCNLATATLNLGLQDAALAIARRAQSLEPGNSLALRTIANTLPYTASADAQTLLAAQRDCAACLQRPATPSRFLNRPEPDRPLRVGLLAGLLKTHPVAWLTLAGFESLDPREFTLIGFAETLPTDAMSRRFRSVARDWRCIAALDDAALADAARSLEVDILIDLGGYGDVGRMTACAHRLAPVQIKWVGMQNHSTGMPEMDWILTDRWETPPDLAQYYTERLLVLPDGYVCYSPPADAPEVASSPAAKNGYVTFGCFTNLAKVTPEVLATWSAVLRRVPDSRFVLKSHALADPRIAERIRAAFASHGVSADRLDLRGPSPHRDFLAQYADMDIALDTFPYCGGLTTVEALWMGVPTLTVPGSFFAARHSLSHLSNAGLPDWAAPDSAGYVAMAVQRASDVAALSVLRGGLRAHVRRSPLCDAPRFGRSLGAALRHAWQEWCGSR